MFLTRLPCPGWCDHHPGYLMRAMAYFPLIGALIGFWAAAFYDAAASLWSPLVAAALSMAGTLWLTGCFHEDGLCDTLDGFGGGWTKSQILKIMRDSRNGSYATMGGCIWVVAKAALLATIGGDASVWALRASVGAGPCLVVAQCLCARVGGAAHLRVRVRRRRRGRQGRVLQLVWRVATPAGADARRARRRHRRHRRDRGAPSRSALRALLATAVGTFVAGEYGRSVLGGRDGRLPRRDHLLPGARRLSCHRRRGPSLTARSFRWRSSSLAVRRFLRTWRRFRAPRLGNGAAGRVLSIRGDLQT